MILYVWQCVVLGEVAYFVINQCILIVYCLLQVMIILLWICLITFTSQHVHSIVITVNTTGGSDNTTCCIDGQCDCSSLSTALNNINNNTVINITSESVTLGQHIVMGSGDNITIIGNGVTIMCNYSGSVELTCNNVCTNIVIEGITWDRCGDPYSANIFTAVMLNTVANVSLRNCTFQYSLMQAMRIGVARGYVTIQNCCFVLNSGGLEIQKRDHSSNLVDVNVLINNSYFNRIGIKGYKSGLKIHDGGTTTVWNISVFKTEFSFNIRAMHMDLTGGIVTLSEVSFHNNHRVLYLHFTGHQNKAAIVSILSSFFRWNNNAVLSLHAENDISTLIKNSTFTENHNADYSIIDLSSSSGLDCLFILIDVQITKNVIHQKYNSHSKGIFSAQFQCATTLVEMKQLNVSSNMYPYTKWGVVYISSNATLHMSIEDSVFTNNTSLHGSTIYLDQIQSGHSSAPTYSIRKSVFDRNSAQNNIIYVKISGPFNWLAKGYLDHLNFTNNFGVCIYLTQLCWFKFGGDVLFVNNTADNGAALYLDQTSAIVINEGANVQFINNSAALHGGAVFIELDCSYQFNVHKNAFVFHAAAQVSFTNNVAGYGPNAVYFSIFKYCDRDIILNTSDAHSIMNVPYQFNYSQIINGTLTHIPIDYNYTWLNVTQFPVVTSPHQLKLYGDGIQFNNNNTYFISDKVLGRPVTFHGIVLDYFDNPAEQTQFHLTCTDC